MRAHHNSISLRHVEIEFSLYSKTKTQTNFSGLRFLSALGNFVDPIFDAALLASLPTVLSTKGKFLKYFLSFELGL